MRSRAAIFAALLLLAALGCDAFSREPAALLEQGRAALEQEDYEAAYRSLAQIRTRFPGRPESVEAFPLAVVAVQKLWKKHRWVQPDSPWVTQEPHFVFDWLGSFFTDDEPPQRELDLVLRGMSPRFFDAFRDYAKTHPVLAGWSFAVTVDDWKVAKVAATRAEQVAHEADAG